MRDTSKGKYSDSGPSYVVFDFNGDCFDFSEDWFDFNDITHGLSEEFLLNSMGQRLQGYFQNEFENFKRKFPTSGQVKQKTKKKKGESNRKRVNKLNRGFFSSRRVL